MSRRPIAAVLDDPDLIVVCDDGTVWNYLRGANEWNRLAAIPGSPAVKKEKEKEKERIKAREKAEERARDNAKKAKQAAAVL
ncbi:MAG TPA: hypothetical protein VFQ21_01120 [Gemmatimonadota bacterium]|nr:hypothetical protein [Gemmatimonadota bacterium]